MSNFTEIKDRTAATENGQTDFDKFRELCWKIQLRDGGTVRESIAKAVTMMAQTVKEI